MMDWQRLGNVLAAVLDADDLADLRAGLEPPPPDGPIAWSEQALYSADPPRSDGDR